jgi:TonB family protein
MRIRTKTDSLVAAMLSSMLMAAAPVALAEEQELTPQLTDSTTDRLPAVTSFPKYPSVARRDRIEGEATVCFIVDSGGRIIRPSIRNSTHRIFEKPALRAIRSSSFEPLRAGEKMATAKTCRTYRFRLDSVTASDDSVPQPAPVQ